MTKPPEWGAMSDAQRIGYRIGYALGCILRGARGKPAVENEHDLTRRALVRRFALRMEREDPIEAIRSCATPPPKEVI